MLNKLIIASHNQGKLQEICSVLADLPLEIQSAGDFDLTEPEEPYLTFVENALHKARYVSGLTGLPALADDSGLCVDHLKGAPGIHSARFAEGEKSDQKNNEKLLSVLHGVTHRSAYFVCTMVLVRHKNDPIPMICQGLWRGEITQQALGENGFGYDPLFYIPHLGKTAAQLTLTEKNSLSHRALALQDIVKLIRSDPYFRDNS